MHHQHSGAWKVSSEVFLRSSQRCHGLKLEVLQNDRHGHTMIEQKTLHFPDLRSPNALYLYDTCFAILQIYVYTDIRISLGCIRSHSWGCISRLCFNLLQNCTKGLIKSLAERRLREPQPGRRWDGHLSDKWKNTIWQWKYEHALYR